MRVRLGIPKADRRDDAVALWRELKAKAVPFPVECSEEEWDVRWGQTGCEFQMLRGGAITTVSRTEEPSLICLSEEVLQEPCDVQLGVLLHEVIHIRLGLGRLHKNFLASLAFKSRSQARASTSNRDKYIFACVSNAVAKSLLDLVAEIGVDRFMASPRYAWMISAHYWRARCRNFYLDGTRSLIDDDTRSLIDPQGIPTSLQPYAAFYELVALDLGLSVVTNEEDREALRSRRDACAAALAATCNDETAGWLERSRIKLFAFDPVPTDPDDDAYDEVCERVLALNA
jgi:hypothetical protein